MCPVEGLTPKRHDTLWKHIKLNPRYIGPFEILVRIDLVTYKLQLPSELSKIHPVFHVFVLKKCLFDETLVIPLMELKPKKV